MSDRKKGGDSGSKHAQRVEYKKTSELIKLCNRLTDPPQSGIRILEYEKAGYKPPKAAKPAIAVNVCSVNMLRRAVPPPLCDCKPPIKTNNKAKMLMLVLKCGALYGLFKTLENQGAWGNCDDVWCFNHRAKRFLKSIFSTQHSYVRDPYERYDMARKQYNLKDVWNQAVSAIFHPLYKIPDGVHYFKDEVGNQIISMFPPDPIRKEKPLPCIKKVVKPRQVRPLLFKRCGKTDPASEPPPPPPQPTAAELKSMEKEDAKTLIGATRIEIEKSVEEMKSLVIKSPYSGNVCKRTKGPCDKIILS